jgi:hypothetical protein
MGAKKTSNESTKTEKKKQEKVIEDRTFGLKNKNKSKTVQDYIKGVQQVVKGTGGAKDVNKEFQERAEKKKAKEEEAFLNSLAKSVKVIKQKDLEEDETAKNILCEFFRAGCCDKGDECEFSHDVNIEFNQGTFDIYTDLRQAKKNLGVEFEINKIAEEKEKKRSKLPQSNIVCKFFLDAVQKKVYGWKWDCPNGEDCHYKHFLPKGYIITTQKDKMQEEMNIEDYYNLEEQIDQERERIGKTGTPVNESTFMEWKRKRDEFRNQDKEDEEKKKKGVLTGMQLFKKQANLFKDDDNAADDFVNENNELEELQNEIAALKDQLNGVEINTELFGGDDNLDEIIDEEEKNGEDEDDS